MNKRPVLLVVIAAVAGLMIYFVAGKDTSSQLDTLYGNVDIRTADLAFRVGGRVAQVLVDEGSAVKAGEPLAQLDIAPLQYQLAIASAELATQRAQNQLLHRGSRDEDIAQAKAQLSAAQAALAEAERQLKRQRSLLDQRLIAQSAVDLALSVRDQNAAQVNAAKEYYQRLNRGFRSEEIAQSDAQLQAFEARVKAAELALADATLTAPSDGIILTRMIEKGMMINAGANAFSLSLTRPVWVRAYVRETQLGLFGSGTRVTLSTDSRPGHPYQGVVGFVSPTAEFTPKPVETADLRTSLVYRLRIHVDDPDEKLLQGMPVTVRLAL